MDKYVVKKPKKPEPPAVTEITLTEDEKVFREKKNDQAKQSYQEAWKKLDQAKEFPEEARRLLKVKLDAVGGVAQ